MRNINKIKCLDKHTGKIVNAYHVEKDGIAYNKDKTLCIGNINCDLIPVNGEDILKLTPAQFYAKYWVLKLPNGTIHKPRELNEAEIDFLNQAFVTNNTSQLVFMNKRKRQINIDLNLLRELMGKLPTELTKKDVDVQQMSSCPIKINDLGKSEISYFIPQFPKVDKYGSIIEDVNI